MSAISTEFIGDSSNNDDAGKHKELTVDAVGFSNGMRQLNEDPMKISRYEHFAVGDTNASLQNITQRQSSLSNMSITPLNIKKARSVVPGQRASRPIYTPPSSAKGEQMRFDPFNSPASLESKRSTSTTRDSVTRDSCSQRTSQRTSRTREEPQTPRSMQNGYFSPQIAAIPDDPSVRSSLNAIASLQNCMRVSDLSTKTYEAMRKKHNCARELFSTEVQFAQDMAAVVRIYMCGSADLGLSVRQIDVLFSNISQILDISLSFVAILEPRVPTQILHGKGSLNYLDIAADKDLKVGQAMCLALTGQLYEVYETYIHNSRDQMDLYYELTKAFNDHPQKRFRLNASKNAKFDTNNIDQQKLGAWLDKCKLRVKKFTTAWALDSLLIKPIQRLGKYPLFLKTMLDCTEETHEDYAELQKAYRRSKHYLDCVNTRFEALNQDS